MTKKTLKRRTNFQAKRTGVNCGPELMSNMECSNYWINFIEKCLQNILKVDLS